MQAEGEAGAVVQHRQGMAAAVEQGEMAFEIHLPQGIGRGVFEALPRPLGGRIGGREPGGATQNRGDGAGGGHGVIAESAEAGVQFAPAPGGVLEAQRDDRGFQGRRGCGAASGGGGESDPRGPQGQPRHSESAIYRPSGTDPEATTEGPQGEAGGGGLTE